MTLDLTMYDVMKDLMEERLEINPRAPAYREFLCPAYQSSQLTLLLDSRIKQILNKAGKHAHDTICRIGCHYLNYDVPTYLDFSLVYVDIYPDPNLDGTSLSRILKEIDSMFRRASLISDN